MEGWFGHGISPLGTTWDFRFVVVLPVLGTSICRAHLHALRFSRLSLLPRILPGLSQVYGTFFPAPSVVQMCGTLSGTAWAFCEAPAWLQELIPVDRLPTWGFQEWKIIMSVDTSYSIGYSISLALSASSSSCLITLLSFIMTLGLIVLSLVKRDAIGCIALVILALSTSCSSMAIYKGQPRPAYGRLRDVSQRSRDSNYTPSGLPGLAGLGHRLTESAGGGTNAAQTSAVEINFRGESTERNKDIILRTRNNALVVVRCPPGVDEFIWKSIEFNLSSSEDIRTTWQLFTTLLYLCGVVLLSISRWQTQVATGATYLITLGLYTVFNPAPLRPEGLKARQLFPAGCEDAHIFKPDLRGMERYASFTRTLWYAIRATRDIKWVLRAKMVPLTPQCREWLNEAMRNIDNKDWPAVSEFERIMLDDDGSRVYGRIPEEEEVCEQQEPKTRDEITPVPAENW
ncbi:hypothetical protein GGS26DRAFT_567186 [Hypomontagnella submonticulosa]|nr:hypothetical protein GGS26DRAFT_567186 [Hypomontagnella submonticulosa]